MVYKHVIGLKTDASQSNLGGNTDSNHLIPGVVGHFPSVSFSRHPVQLVILIPFFFSPASDAGFLRFVRGSLTPRCFFVLFPAVFRGFLSSFPGIGCRLFFVLCPSLYLGPCFYSAGCYPAFSYVYSPASDAGVLPPLWRGRVFPFTVQSRDHLATITDIYVPSFLRPVRGSLAPRLLLSIPRHSMPAFSVVHSAVWCHPAY